MGVAHAHEGEHCAAKDRLVDERAQIPYDQLILVLRRRVVNLNPQMHWDRLIVFLTLFEHLVDCSGEQVKSEI